MKKRDIKSVLNETFSGWDGDVVGSKPAKKAGAAPQQQAGGRPHFTVPVTKYGTQAPSQASYTGKGGVPPFVKGKQPDYDTVTLADDPNARKGADWAKNGGNFPVMRNGQMWWVSRSVSASLYAFCRNDEGEWCILITQRGPKAQNANGLWTVPCGYLDYGETLEDAALRETYEETGVDGKGNQVDLMGINSHPGGRRQDISARFASVFEGTTDDYPTDISNCEPGEISDAIWLPLSMIDDKSIKWAYGMNKKIIGQAETSLGDWESDDDTDSIKRDLAHLKRLVGQNRQALILIDKIIGELTGGKGV